MVDEARRETISQDIYRRRKTEVGDSVHIDNDADSDDEDLIGYDAIEPGLPPASSDRQRWWLDNKQPTRANVPIPNGRDGQPMALNPNRPSNPFGHEEHDWISVERSSSRASFSSLSSSPYEKVMLPHGLANRPTARKLPPAHDLASKVGRMSFDHEAPPPPPPRRSTAGLNPAPPVAGLHRTGTIPSSSLRPTSSASHSLFSSQLPGKSPPPVAKKPSHLVSSPTGSSFKSQPGNTFGNDGSGRSDISSRKPLAPSKPAVNGRLTKQPPPRQQGAVDLLDSLDDGGQGMGSWETLQPSR